MSKDRYSDSHTIDVFQGEKELTIHASGSTSRLILKAGDAVFQNETLDSNVYLNAETNVIVWADEWISSRSKKLRLRTRIDGVAPSNTVSVLSGDIAVEATNKLHLYADSDINVNAGGGIEAISMGLIVENSSTPDDTGNYTGLVVRNKEGQSGYIAKFQTGAGNVWKTRITDEGQVQCKSLKIEDGSPEPGMLLRASDTGGSAFWAWADVILGDPAAGEAYVSTGGDSNRNITISAPRDILVSADDDISVHAGDTLRLSADDDVTISSTEGEVWINSDDGVYLMGVKESGYVAYVRNNSDSDQADGLQINLGKTNPNPTNNWVQFTADGDSRGAIQGSYGYSAASDYSDGTYDMRVLNMFRAKYVEGDASAHSPGHEREDSEVLGEEGYVMFVSGSADFGEFIEVGDIDEWPETNQKTWKLGIPEGCVVWVDNNKFYKESKGTSTPMIVTDRAIVVGNGLPAIKDSGVDAIGEILSFIGQLPVFIAGPSKNGDLIVPVANENFCRCISKDEITFQEYMSAIGTVWEDREDPGENTLHRVMCAIGKK